MKRPLALACKIVQLFVNEMWSRIIASPAGRFVEIARLYDPARALGTDPCVCRFVHAEHPVFIIERCGINILGGLVQAYQHVGYAGDGMGLAKRRRGVFLYCTVESA